MRTTLRKALNDAIKAGYLARNPVDSSEPVKVSRRAAAYLSVDEAHAFLAESSKERLSALYLVMLSLGLRKGETLALYWDDVDLDAEIVTIRRSLKRERIPDGRDAATERGRKTRLVVGSPKTENSWRTLNLPASAVSALRDHRRQQAAEKLAAECWGDDKLVFATPIGTAIDPTNLGKNMSVIAQRAGTWTEEPASAPP